MTTLSSSKLIGIRLALFRAARRDPVGLVSALFILLVIVGAAAAPLITRYDPNALGTQALTGLSADHWAGTDKFGRDVFTRTLYGARVSLVVGFSAAILGSGGALLLALLFTYAGGGWDYLYQRFVDTIQALPTLILLIVLVQTLGPSILTISVILGLRASITSSRIMRSAILGVMLQDYIMGAITLGASAPRIMFRHVVPNVFALTIVTGTLQLGGFIIAEASLSFLGLGIAAPTASWGSMMGVDGRAYIVQAPWMLIAPAIMLSLTVIAANMCGDWVRDTVDPRLRGRG